MTAYLDVEASTNQACACILPSSKINSIFLWKYFELSYDKLRSLAQGAGQPNLNGNMIKNFRVLVPPIELQNEYVDFINKVDKSKIVNVLMIVCISNVQREVSNALEKVGNAQKSKQYSEKTSNTFDKI